MEDNQIIQLYFDRADIAKQSTDANKQKLTKKYETTFAKKQEEIQKNYANKLRKCLLHNRNSS